MEKITVNNNYFKDEYNRERIFNGINICDKGIFNGKSRDYTYEWEEGRARKLKENGLNLVRLGITWDALEPQMDFYNEKYLDAIEKIMDDCAENDVYVYLDMHQDLFSGFGNGPGDGAPDWACLKDGYEYKLPKYIWGEGYYFNKAVKRCFDNFWDNKPLTNGTGVQDKYIELWAMLAKRFGNHPALMGFDIMNEPYIGTNGGKLFTKLIMSAVRKTLFDRRLNRHELIKKLKVKGKEVLALDEYSPQMIIDIMSAAQKGVEKFEKEKYSPFLVKTSKAIRKETPNGTIMIENNYFSNFAVPCSLKPIELDGKAEPNQCFAPHAYDIMVDTPLYKYANNDRLKAIFGMRRNEQETTLNMPVVVGEWGGNSDGTQWLPHVEFLLSLYDSYKWSNTYWAYYDGIFDSELMGVLKRPHPIAVSGTIISYCHNRDENTFELEFNNLENCTKETEIFVHKKVKAVECSGTFDVNYFADDSGILTLKADSGINKIKIYFEGEGFSYKSSK